MKKKQFIAIAIIIITIAVIAIMLNVNKKQEKTNDSSVNSADSAQEITNIPVQTPAIVLTATPTPIPMDTATPTPVASPVLPAREEMPDETEIKTVDESNKTAEQEDKKNKAQTIITENGEMIISSGDAENGTDSSEKSQQAKPQQESVNDFSDGSIELPMVVVGE